MTKLTQGNSYKYRLLDLIYKYRLLDLIYR